MHTLWYVVPSCNYTSWFSAAVFVHQESRQIATGGAPEYAHIEQQTMQQLLQAAEADEGWLNKVVRPNPTP